MGIFQKLFKKQQLPAPKSNKEEILLHLIQHGSVSIFDFPYLSGFRARISELKIEEHLDIESQQMCGKNKFGNTYTYHVHYLKNREMAVEKYELLSSKN